MLKLTLTQRGGLKTSPLFLLQLFLFLGAWALVFFKEPSFPRASRPLHILLNSEILSHLAGGFKQIAADGLWLRLVQELDYREGQEVSKGWVFHMLDNVTTLDPRYKMAYVAGTTVLSVVVQDVEGARIIYERGIKNYPTFWPLLYRAGYHYLYEVKDCKRAAELLLLASQNGAPSWLSSLASRLYVRSGQVEIAKSVLVDSIKRFEGADFEPQLRKRLNEIESMKHDKLPVDCRISQK